MGARSSRVVSNFSFPRRYIDVCSLSLTLWWLHHIFGTHYITINIDETLQCRLSCMPTLETTWCSTAIGSSASSISKCTSWLVTTPERWHLKMKVCRYNRTKPPSTDASISVQDSPKQSPGDVKGGKGGACCWQMVAAVPGANGLTVLTRAGGNPTAEHTQWVRRVDNGG